MSSSADPSSLPNEFAKTVRRSKKYARYIRHLNEETEKSYQEIDEKRIFTPEQMLSIRLKKTDRAYVESLSNRPLALIVCSQTYGGKSRFVNELLTEHLLPEPPKINETDLIRMIRIKHHPITSISSIVSGSFEVLISPNNVEPASWSTVPAEEILVHRDFAVPTNEEHDETAAIEIRKPLDLLGDDLQIVITPTNLRLDLKQIHQLITENVVPIFIYVIDQYELSQSDIEELKIFHQIIENEPILFVRLDSYGTESGIYSETPSVRVFRQLCDLGFLSVLTTEETEMRSSLFQSDLIDHGLTHFQSFLNYIRKHIDRLMIYAVQILQLSHETCLNFLNDSAFDMARDILVTPTRLNYARDKERELHDTLVFLTNSKQGEIQQIIQQVIKDLEENLIDEACALEIPGVELTDVLTVKTTRDLRRCTNFTQDFVLEKLNDAIARRLSESVHVLHEDYVGTLTRCLKHLEGNQDEDGSTPLASKALQDILQSAYQVNVSIPTSSNLFRILIQKMRELFHTANWSNSPKIDPDFKRSVAIRVLQRLSAVKLARTVCSQINDRIRLSHESFETLLKQLEQKHSDRLRSTEDKQQRLRKEFTPKIARHLLESTSLKDFIQYGLPRQGRELGRGQYGVVYECDSWANQRSCVVKSVVPPDDRHWNDLALEFHYLRQIPEHPRVVKLIGSVIDYTYRDQTPVLLVMERLRRDLHTALKTKLDFMLRIRIALDVIEGLRYLHGLGLVHRDIKLKNVLLDNEDRARLTDLGFCKPEVMMSGSLVGTPIHMAPELFTSKYDHTVDVYAFGILFWYICANSVKLPVNFDVCPSKDILWTRVKQGLRPERLSTFSEECWSIMSSCWDTQPNQRPYLGEVQQQLEQILANNRNES